MPNIARSQIKNGSPAFAGTTANLSKLNGNGTSLSPEQIFVRARLYDMIAIDVVITWVDGASLELQHKRTVRLNSCGLSDTFFDPTRFHSCGEIEYCVQSWLRHAPWVRTIYIITDDQTPSFLTHLTDPLARSKIKIIDHRVIFRDFDEHLPTFNSLSIETMLWRIPELSEHFIYCNDDCFLLRPVVPEDFFRDNRIVERGRWSTQSSYRWKNKLARWLHVHDAPVLEQHRAMQEKSARLSGFERSFLHLAHAPTALRRSTYARLFAQDQEAWIHNASYPLRHRAQFWPVSWVVHEEFRQHTACLDDVKEAITINPACHSARKIKARATYAQKNATFMCLQSLDSATPREQEELLRYVSIAYS